MKHIMYFSAIWCGPCKGYKPKFQKLSEDHADKAKFSIIDIDDQSDMAMKHKIRGVPTVVICEDGAEVSRAAGVDQIQKLLESLN